MWRCWQFVQSGYLQDSINRFNKRELNIFALSILKLPLRLRKVVHGLIVNLEANFDTSDNQPTNQPSRYALSLIIEGNLRY